jgi:hypothetical protein
MLLILSSFLMYSTSHSWTLQNILFFSPLITRQKVNDVLFCFRAILILHTAMAVQFSFRLRYGNGRAILIALGHSPFSNLHIPYDTQ